MQRSPGSFRKKPWVLGSAIITILMLATVISIQPASAQQQKTARCSFQSNPPTGPAGPDYYVSARATDLSP